MEENAKARDSGEPALVARQPLEFSYGHRREGCRDLLTELCEAAHDELGLLRGKGAGHRWDGWRRLTGGVGCFAAFSCGWRSTQAGCVSLMLRQVKEHLDAVWAVRSGRSRFVAVLERAVAPQHRAERAEELRNGIIAAAGALAAMAQEVALAGQDLETGCLGGSARYRRRVGEPANRHGVKESVIDDLHLASGLGRAAD